MQPGPTRAARTTQSQSRGVTMLESHWSNTKNTVLLFVENATSSLSQGLLLAGKSERGDGEVLIGDGETHRYETQGTVRLPRE